MGPTPGMGAGMFVGSASTQNAPNNDRQEQERLSGGTRRSGLRDRLRGFVKRE